MLDSQNDYEEFERDGIMTTGISSSRYAALENTTATSKRKVKRELKRAGAYDKSMKPLLKVQAAENRMEQVALTGELDIKDKLKNKLIQAGFTTPDGQIDIERLQKLVSKYIGTDHNTNYQTERNNLIAAFNQNENEVEFSKKEVLKITKALGADVEKKFNWWRAAGVGAAGAVGGGLVGALFQTKGYFKEGDIDHSLNIDTGGLADITENTHVDGEAHSFSNRISVIPGAIVGFGLAFAGDLITQARRDEKSVTGRTRPEMLLECKNLRQFNLCADRIGTKKGGPILKQIAAFYADEAGNIDRESLKRDMIVASGKNSVLNEVEALKMLEELKAHGRPEPVAPAPEPVDIEPIEIEDEDIDIEQAPTPAPEPEPEPEPEPPVQQQPAPEPIEGPCYQVVVQNNESPAMLAQKYGVSVKEILELNKSQVKLFSDCEGKRHKGFLVGAVIDLPCDANIENAKGNLTSKQSQQLYENIFIKKANDGDVWCPEKQATRKELYDLAVKNAQKRFEQDQAAQNQ